MLEKQFSSVQSLSCARLFCDPWTAACQASLSMGFSRQGYRNGLPFPSPEDLPHLGIQSKSLALQTDSLPTELPRKHPSSGEGNGNPFQYPCLENPMDRAAWQVTVHGVTKSQTQLSNSHFLKRRLFIQKDCHSSLYCFCDEDLTYCLKNSFLQIL